MFSIYGVTGQSFRGTLEEFLAVPRLAAGRNARGIAREGEEPGPEMVRHGQPGPDNGHYQQAARAYREMLQLPSERGPVLHAFQLMTREVFCLRPDDTVEAGWHALAGRGLGQAPVLDGAQRLVGLVTSRDLLTVVKVEGGQLRDVLPQTVADIMLSPVVSADPVTDIRRVARVLLELHLPGIPVVSERDELVGILTRSDILRTLVNDPPLSLWA